MRKNQLILISLVALLALAACSGGRNPQPTLISASPTVEPTPTSTPEPLAARVNGDGISLADFQAELGRFQAALAETGGTATDEEARQRVLDALIDETLLAQAALASGFQSSDADVQASLDQMTLKIGGVQALADWQRANGYDDAGFRRALARSQAAAWQRDQILASVPTSAEQVHARQIFVLDLERAVPIISELSSGADFATLAQKHDAVTGGELGWFPRGYLTQPAVEEAAFALQPNQYSPVVQSDFGYHIIQVLERETRPLAPDALRVLQRTALAEWLKQRRAQSQIETLLP